MNFSIVRTFLLTLLALAAVAARPAAADVSEAPQRATVGTPEPGRGDVHRVSRGEWATFSAIREDGNRQLEALQRTVAAMPDGPARQEAMKRAETIKRETWARVLRAGAQFARERGDLLRARDLEGAASRLLDPPAPVLDSRARTVPTKPFPVERRAR